MTLQTVPELDQATANVIADAREAFDFLATQHAMRFSSARQVRSRWRVTFTSRAHEVVISSDDGSRIDVTVDGRDLRSQVLDLVSLGGLLPPSEEARVAALGRATGRRTPHVVLHDHAELLRRHARWLLPSTTR